MMSHMYASVTYALRINKSFLALTSRQFCKMTKKTKQRVTKATPKEDLREIYFALGQSARMTHSAPYKYKMPISLKEEIKPTKNILHTTHIKLELPIGHIVPRWNKIDEAANACKKAGGGWSIDLSF